MNAKEMLEMDLKIELDRLRKIELETIDCENKIVALKKRIRILSERK
jgi:hypothetical protein